MYLKSKQVVIQKSRVFELCLLKWFQSTFTTNERTWGEIAFGYIPDSSALFSIRAVIDRNKHINGKMVSISRRLPANESDPSQSPAGFAKTIYDFAVDYSRNTYLSAPSSKSPDLLVMPPTGDKRIIIGSLPSAFMEEILTKRRLLRKSKILTRSFWQMKTLKPTLILF